MVDLLFTFYKFSALFMFCYVFMHSYSKWSLLNNDTMCFICMCFSLNIGPVKQNIFQRKIAIIFLYISLNMCFGGSKEPSH